MPQINDSTLASSASFVKNVFVSSLEACAAQNYSKVPREMHSTHGHHQHH